jgi:EH_Signature domain
MSSAEPGLGLLEALRVLQVSVRELSAEAEHPFPTAEESLEKLPRVIEQLGQTRQARPSQCPPEYEKQWAEVLSGNRETLEPRAIRYLCWNPDVATDRSFQYFLDRSRHPVNARSLQGMITCCHSRWSEQFASSQVVARVHDRLNHYDGPNRLLTTWKSHASMILGPGAHQAFAREFIRAGTSIGQHCRSWGISEEPSFFLQMAVENAGVICLDEIDRVNGMKELLFREIIPWTGWSPDRLKSVFSRLILESPKRKAELVEPVTRLVMGDRRFGDPRQRHNHNNWLGMDEAARRVKEWLSTADITFFFEHVLPDKKDPHGRKAFWLRYVGCRGLVSRPLLNEFDKYRLRDILWKKREEVSHFGVIEGNTSAFLLDFGPILVVEFSAVGNACYVYEKRAGQEIVSDFWTPKSFRVSDLKSVSKAVNRVIHKKARFASWQRDGWEDEMAGILARYGIRAVS